MISSMNSPDGETFQARSHNNCDKLELILFTLLFQYYLTCLHNLHWGYAILVQGKPGHCLMVMHSWNRAPQYFDCYLRSERNQRQPDQSGSGRQVGRSVQLHTPPLPPSRLSHSEVWTAPPAYSRPETLNNPRVHISYRVEVFISSRQ